MGTVSVAEKNKKTNNLANPPKLKITLDVDAQKPLPSILSQLINWSFDEIKNSLQIFQRFSQSPMLDSFLFHKIMPFSKKNCDIIFAILSKGAKYISVYEIICILVLTSYQTYKKKFQFLLLVFDFQHRGCIEGRDFLLIFQSMVYGFCRLTEQPLIKFSQISKFAVESFFPGEDDYETKDINLLKFIIEHESNVKITALFNRFQQNQLKEIKEDFNLYLLSTFKKFTRDQVTQLYRILYKVYKKGDYEEVEVLEQNKEMRRQNRRDSCLRQIIEEKSMIANPSILKNLQTPPRNRVNSHIFNSLSKLKTIPVPEGAQTERKSTSFRLKKGSSQQKLIFLKGKSYSKKDIFDTITYFKSISENEDKVGIKDFFKKFEKKSFMKKQLSSIFKLLDYKNKGEIDLECFFKALYPGMTTSDIKLLFNWHETYQQIYESDRLARNLSKPVEMTDARLLPKDTLDRMKQIMFAMDIGNKGYLNFEDLRKAYKQGFTADELILLLKEYGNENKIHLSGLCKMLLPQGWEIQGVNIDELQ